MFEGWIKKHKGGLLITAIVMFLCPISFFCWVNLWLMPHLPQLLQFDPSSNRLQDFLDGKSDFYGGWDTAAGVS